MFRNNVGNFFSYQNVVISSFGRSGWRTPKKEVIRYYCNRNILALRERGLVSGTFPSEAPFPDKLANLCIGKPQTVYAGFDPTSDSLHVGNLAILMMLLQCQRAGHRVIALIGGATGMVGDPSGKSSERSELDVELVSQNSLKIAENIKSVFANHEKYFWKDKKGTESLTPLEIVNNLDWYRNLNCLELVGKIGRHFRISAMLAKESVKSRLKSEEGMSFTEFTYQVFQGYDFLHLHNNYKCNIQIGGHDQLGNIQAGHDLIGRSLRHQVYGITVPLITTEMGNKYGKTAGNAVWLNEDKTNSFDLYQFFIRTRDADVHRLLNMFTFKSKDEIEAIIRKHQNAPEERRAQLQLAEDVTRLVHGERGLKSALLATEAVYSENIDALCEIPAEKVIDIFQSPGGAIGASEIYLQPGFTVLEMAIKAGCFKTEQDAMRIIHAGGFYLNYRRISNYEEVIVPGIHILANKISLARVGKKNYHVIKWNY